MSCTEHLVELESLRSQVAELSRVLAERDRPAQNQPGQADAARCENERRLHFTQFALDHAPDAVLWADDSSRFIYANDTACRMLGYRKEELLALSIPDIAPLHDSVQFQQRLDQLSQGTAATYESVHRRKDGTEYPIEVSVTYLEHEGQGYTCGIIRNIAARKRVEQEMHVQHARLVAAQALAHVGSWNWNLASGSMEWSDEQFRIFGHEPGSMSVTHEAFWAALLPDDHDRILAAINATLLGPAPCEIECRIVRPNGDVREIHCRGGVQRDAAGHPLRMAGTVLDVTEQRQAERALRASEERWQLAVRGSNDGIWDWDIPSGNIFFSSRWKAMRGFEEHELANHVDEWRSRIHPDDLDRVLQSIDAYLAKHIPEFSEECRVQRKEGSYMWVMDRGVALWADDGTPLRMAGSETDITERKNVEQSLQESEGRYRLLTEATFDGIAIHDQGILIEVNPGLEKMFGYGPGELIGKHILDLVADESREMVVGNMRTGASEPYESVGRRKDGSTFYGEIVVKPYRYQGREVRLVAGRDITERKRAEEVRQAGEARVNLVLEATNDGIWDWNIETGVVYFSPQWLRLLGYLPEEVAPSTAFFFAILHPEDQARTAQVLQSHLDGWTPNKEIEVRLRHKSGDYLWFLDRGKVVAKDTDGRPARMVGAITDITDRKRVEEALRVSEARFNLAVHGSNTGIWDWDLRTNKTYFSPLWKSMLGYEEHELRGEFSEWEERLHPDDRERALATVRAYLEGVTPQYELEHRLRHKDGTYRWILARGVSISDAEGTPYRMAGSHIDITEQRQIQEALAQRERQLRTVLDALPVGIWFTDQSGKPILANPAARQIWSGVAQIGVETAANAAGWWEAIGSSSELHRWALSHALTKGIPSLYETLDLECLDGTKKTIRNSTVPVRDEAGAILGAIVVNEDITALRQAQEALKLTRFSVDHAPDLFIWAGPDGRILDVNEAACRILEYSREELLASSVLDIDPSFSRERWAAHWEDVKQKGSLTFESKQWSRSGRVLDMEITVNYLQYDGREYICAIMRDIEERMMAEEELRRSHAFIRQIIDTDPNFIFAKDREGRFTLVNKAVADAFGTTVDCLIGKTDGDFNPNREEVEFFRRIDVDVMDSLQERFIPEERITDSTGKTRWLQTVKRPILDAEGRAIMVLGAATDITERKRMEEVIRQRERDLRAAIEERERISQDLHDGILQSLFAVGLSLETTKSMMSLKERKTSGPALKQAIDQLNRLMHEVRNFIAGLGSDLLQGKDLPTALHHMLETLTKHHPTHVRLKIEDRAAQALSAEQSLHLLLVIQEAVSNCIRHGHAREATVSLKLLKQGVRLSVRDNGCGFDSAVSKGIGHGLANMAARAQKIGGRLTVLSKMNEGTRVVLDLPKEAVLAHS